MIGVASASLQAATKRSGGEEETPEKRRRRRRRGRFGGEGAIWLSSPEIEREYFGLSLRLIQIEGAEVFRFLG